MALVKEIIFWADGIFFNALDDAVTTALKKPGRENINLFTSKRYFQARDALATGKTDGGSFLKETMDAFGAKEPEADFYTRVLGNMAAVEGALKAVSLLKEEYGKSLFVDIPREWFLKLPVSAQLLEIFPAGRVFYSAESGLNALEPDVFYFLPGAVGCEPGHCLLLDGNMKRTVNAINHGLPAGVIVHPERLMREFLLRGFVGMDYRMHPRPVLEEGK